MSKSLLYKAISIFFIIFSIQNTSLAQFSTTDLPGTFIELPLDVQGGDVHHMEFHNGLLYLTGSFNGGFAIYNPVTEVTSIPDLGLKGFGHQFTRFGNQLFIVGDFIMAGEFTANNIVAFDLETNSFLQPPSDLTSAETLLSVTTNSDAVFAVKEDGIIMFTPTETGFSSENLSYFSAAEIQSSPEPYLRSLIIGDYVAVGGQTYTVYDTDYFILGRIIESGQGSVITLNPLPDGSFSQPDETRVRDMIYKDDYALILRESGIIAYVPANQFIPDPWHDPFYKDFIRPTAASSRLLHNMDGFLYMLAVNDVQIKIGRQLLKGGPFRFNIDLSLNENFKNGTFNMTSLEGMLYIAGPISGVNPEQQVTLFAADLTSDIIDWSLTLRALEGKDISRSLTIGTSGDASDDFDILFDRMAPPLPPDGAFDARIKPDLIRDYRMTTDSETVWEIPVIQSAQKGLIALEWDPQELDEIPGILLLDILSSSDTTSINMRHRMSYERDDEEVLFIIRHLLETPFTQEYPSGWFLIGSPQSEPFDPITGVRHSVNETLFGFNGAYTDETSMIAGQGYWLYSSDVAEATFTPPFEDTITRFLRQGWNLVSGVWQPTPLNLVTDPSGILVPGTLYSFDSGYTLADAIKPGKGYWVMASESGEITISLEGDISAGKRPPEVALPEGFMVFEVSHGTVHSLEFIQGEHSNVESDEIKRYAMPPLPPADAFDIRFSNNSRLVNQIDAQLDVRNPKHDLTITLYESPLTDGQWLDLTLYYGNVDTPELELQVQPGETVTLAAKVEDGRYLAKIITRTGGVVSIDDVERITLPAMVELRQNYPNPFNPSTTIGYSIPEMTDVRLDVYNMLGQHVTTMVEQNNHAAGFHSVRFDATGLSSGMYVYRLHAGNTVITKKFTLIK
ncbi:MAG: T9SS type A sorting domain-containing protein [Balneolales bacterium]|nr:T9SS type A sorting domain-containing protein [Balneolales bacterium]